MKIQLHALKILRRFIIPISFENSTSFMLCIEIAVMYKVLLDFNFVTLFLRQTFVFSFLDLENIPAMGIMD